MLTAEMCATKTLEKKDLTLEIFDFVPIPYSKGHRLEGYMTGKVRVNRKVYDFAFCIKDIHSGNQDELIYVDWNQLELIVHAGIWDDIENLCRVVISEQNFDQYINDSINRRVAMIGEIIEIVDFYDEIAWYSKHVRSRCKVIRVSSSDVEIERGDGKTRYFVAHTDYKVIE